MPRKLTQSEAEEKHIITPTELIEEYVNKYNVSKEDVCCNQCGRLLLPKSDPLFELSIIKKNCICFIQGTRLLIHEKPELVKEWDYEKNKDININEITVGINKKAWWICKKCGISYQSKINHRTSGKGCAKCRESRGEKKIRKELDKFNIKYVAQKKMKNCMDQLPLPFDFYLPQYNLCIEYQGEQHYIVSKRNRWGRNQKQQEKDLNKLKRHDQLKRNFCQQEGIELLEIPYWDFNRIEEILVEKLNLVKPAN